MGRSGDTGLIFLHGHNLLDLRRVEVLQAEALSFQFDTVFATPYSLTPFLWPHFAPQLDLHRHCKNLPCRPPVPTTIHSLSNSSLTFILLLGEFPSDIGLASLDPACFKWASS